MNSFRSAPSKLDTGKYTGARKSFAAFHRTMRNPNVCVLTALVVGISVAFLLTAVRGVPAPVMGDEFAYLLGADTFSSGRVTNPTHPMWHHFESFQIIHEPSYNSKYPPAQSLTLAFGKLLGHPFIGACLTTGVALAAMVWMLTGWLPRKYFWLVWLFAVFHPAIHLAWGQSYWGGSVALIGASLLLGALGRITARMQIRYAVIAAVGTILLATSRPFEGAVLTAVVGSALVWKFWRTPGWNLKPFLIRVIAPGALVFGLGACCILTYNASVTGDPFKMPYQVHESTYGWNPFFLWQSAGEKPHYRHETMERFFELDKTAADSIFRTLGDAVSNKSDTALSMINFFGGGIIVLAALGLPWVIRKPRYRLASAMLIPVFLAALVSPWAWPHYCAPAGPLLVLLMFAGWIEIWKRTRHLPVYRLAILLILPVFQILWSVVIYSQYGFLERDDWGRTRVAVHEQLIETPGQDLVFVHYSEHHNLNYEWVYNEADIDGAQVVWAREISTEKDNELIQYFNKRKVWILDADATPPVLTPVDSNRHEHSLGSK